MSKKYNKIPKKSQYDDYDEEEHFHAKKRNKAKSNHEFDMDWDYMCEQDMQRQKANNRYLNKKKDKHKYDRYDNWN